jgi:hypothetical protein
MTDSKPEDLSSAQLAMTSQGAGGDAAPTAQPPQQTTGAQAGTSGPQAGPPPQAAGAGATAGATVWQNDKRIVALWGINQNRNSWAYVNGIGWKKLANNSDTAVVALTALAAHARQLNSSVSYREEADALIHEMYVW